MILGILRGKSLVYYTQPGVEGEIYGMQVVFNTLKSGGRCVFVASTSIPENTKSRFKEFGWDIAPFIDRLFFVDAFNPLIGAPSKERFVVSNPDDINSFSKIIIDAIKELPPSTVVFGSLSTIIDLCGEKETIEAVKSWNRIASLYNHITVYNFTAWPYSQETLNSIQKDLFNAVIFIGHSNHRNKDFMGNN